MRKGLQRKIQRLQKHLAMWEEQVNILEQDYDNLFEQLNAESDADRRNNFQRKLALKEKDIREAEANYNQIEEELESIGVEVNKALPESADHVSGILQSIQSLRSILEPYSTQISPLLKQAFEFCCPEGWLAPQPQTLEGVLRTLSEEMQPIGSNQYLLKFVAFLTVAPRTPELVRQALVDWGNLQTEDFAGLKIQVNQHLIAQKDAKDPVKSYLMILIEEPHKNSNDKNSNEYWANAYFIPDIEVYEPQDPGSYKQLENAVDDQYTYEKHELKVLVQGYLKECEKQRLNDLVIEIFLPLPLLNEAVEAWKRTGYDPEFLISIGWDYKVLVRSRERLKNYRHQHRWQDKWEQLNSQLNDKAYSVFPDIDCGCDYGDLLSKLRRAIAFKQDKALPKETRVFSALLETATPIALWLRRDLSIPDYQQSQFNTLMQCSMKELPEKIKDKRCETMESLKRKEDSHIGHHLALLWENPDRLPPTDDVIEYAAS